MHCSDAGQDIELVSVFWYEIREEWSSNRVKTGRVVGACTSVGEADDVTTDVNYDNQLNERGGRRLQ